MKTVKIIVFVLLILIVLIFVIGAILGIFTKVSVVEKQEGGFKVVGLEYTGPYQQSGKYMKEVTEKLKEAGISDNMGFGIYYDDPKTTPADKCRSYVGAVLDKKEYDKVEQLKTKGFRIDSLAMAPSVIVEFPIKSSLSYMIGAMKAYPAISAFMVERSLKPGLAIELYDMKEKKITYIMQCAQK